MEARNELKYILSHTYDLLKFAEAKHAGLIILNTCLTVGVISSYNIISNITYKPMLLIGVIALGLSVFVSIISQFPITSNKFYTKTEIENPNIYFFEHLAGLNHEDFILVYKKIDNAFTPVKFHNDLINQILVNARIVRSKFLCFKIASYLTVFGIGVIGTTTIMKVIFHF